MSIELPEIPQRYHASEIPYNYVKRSIELYYKCLDYLSTGRFPCFIQLEGRDCDLIVDPLIKRLKEAGYGARIMTDEDNRYLAIDKVCRL